MPAEDRGGLGLGVSLPVTALWLLFWWQQLIGERLLFMRDLSFFAAPTKQYWLERLGAGELPAWSAQTPILHWRVRRTSCCLPTRAYWRQL